MGQSSCGRKKVLRYLVGAIVCLTVFFVTAFLDFASLLSESPCEPTDLGCGTPFDIRITKGFGTKDYNQVRVTIISTNVTPPAGSGGFFTHSARFRYKWMQNHLHTAMLPVKSGSATRIP